MNIKYSTTAMLLVLMAVSLVSVQQDVFAQVTDETILVEPKLFQEIEHGRGMNQVTIPQKLKKMKQFLPQLLPR